MDTPIRDLALNGGSPVRSTPFPARGHFDAAEKAAVDALLDEAIASGSAPGYNGEIENAYCAEFATTLGGGYVDAVSSGTAGIYVSLRALDPEPFGEVIVGAVTDPGGMMPIPLLNQIPVIADTAPDSYNTGPEQVAPLISPLTRAIVIPHIAGEPADIDGIAALARKHSIAVIEDCSQTHGATLHGRPLGTFGDIAAFSTMYGKHHSSGGQGGLVFTRDEALYQRIRRASDRGKPYFLPEGSTNVVASLNLNLNDLAAAIGRVQLRKLPANVLRRQTIAAQLREAMRDIPGVALPDPIAGAIPSYWFLRVRFHADALVCDKETYCAVLRAEGLPVATDYRAALPHTMTWFTHRRVFGESGYPWSSPAYRGDPRRVFPCENAQATMDRHFNLYIHEGWGDAEVQDAIAIFCKVSAAFVRR